MEQLAELTPSLCKGFLARLELVVISPPKVRSEQFIVLVYSLEVSGQLLGGVEVHHIDEGVRGGEVGHLRPVHHHGDHVVGQDVEVLLRDVVLADTVLPGQIKLVGVVQHLVAIFALLSTAGQISTFSVDINFDIF